MANVPVQNTSAGVTGKTLALLEGSQTITGSKTFDLGASPPFVCVSGAAKVPNLDADKLDGEEGTDYHDAAQLTGVLPVTVVGADPNADRIVFWDDSAGAYAFLELVTGLASISGTQLTIPVDRSLSCGRLTLTTATPVTTSDVTAATTLYFALYGGDQIALYNGTVWVMFAISELSIAVPATTNQMYDVFVDYNGGTPALAVTAWTNDTTRATALTLQDGVLVLTGATGKRYVGSFRTTGVSGQTEDSVTKRFVWNYYHRVQRPVRVFEATNTWNYTTATWRQANNAATNQIALVIGVVEDMLGLTAVGIASNGTGARMYAGIGQNVTNAPVANSIGMIGSAQGVEQQVRSEFLGYPAAGYSFWAWLEKSEATGTTTWYGDNGTTDTQSGLSGWVRG